MDTTLSHVEAPRRPWWRATWFRVLSWPAREAWGWFTDFVQLLDGEPR